MPFFSEGEPKRLAYNVASVLNTFSKVSTTTFFKVTFPIEGGLKGWLTNVGLYDASETDGFDGMEKIELLCSEATIPGPSFKSTEIIGNRQGVVEKFPLVRAFPELALTFYVDSNHAVIRFFEEWYNYINPLYYGNKKIISTRRGQSDSGAYQKAANYKFKYPNEYTQTIQLTKFEKDLKSAKSSSVASSSYYTYEFIQAFPANIQGAPVSYNGSQVMKYTVVFDYMRYITRRTPGKSSARSNSGRSSINSIGIADLATSTLFTSAFNQSTFNASTNFQNTNFGVDSLGKIQLSSNFSPL
jgi:hypothetical protein